MEYLVLIVLTFICSYLNDRLTNRTKTTCIIIILLYIVFLMGFRYRVGLDTLNYMEGYQDLPNFRSYELSNFIFYRYEPGYLVMCMICKEISNDFFMLQIFQSIILNTSVIYFFYKHCKNPFLALLIYYYVVWPYFNTEILRESIAISIFFLNYKNLIKGRYLRYYLWILLAICFHFSAIILCFFPLYKNIKCNRYFFITLILLLFSLSILNSTINILGADSIGARLKIYSSVSSELNLNWRLAALIKYMSIPVFLLIISYWSHYRIKYMNFILLQILCCIGLIAIPIIFARFTNYTYLFVIVSCAQVLSSKKVRAKIKLSVIVIILISQVHYYYNMYPAWFPYHSIFAPVKDSKREILWNNSF